FLLTIPAPPAISTLSLHDALPISGSTGRPKGVMVQQSTVLNRFHWLWRSLPLADDEVGSQISSINFVDAVWEVFSRLARGKDRQDRKSTRLNSSHDQISYAVFCLK